MQLAERLKPIGADPEDDEDLRARKALLVLISVLILPVAGLWAALYLSFQSPVGWAPVAYFAVLAGSIVVFSRTRNFLWLLRVGQIAILFAPTLSMIPLGGFLGAGGVGLWAILAPLGSLVFERVETAVRWYVAFAVVFLGSGIAGEIVGPVSPEVPRWFTTTMLGLNITVGGAIVFTLLAVFASERRQALDALRIEQAKAEELLLNILPKSIAERLKAQTRPIADHFGSASILFADVVDFTPWSEGMQPEQVVGHLDLLFSHFDGLAEEYGLEKIKTIGDAYMVAGGIPLPRDDHAEAIADMALAMSAELDRVAAPTGLALEARFGIDTGPVVAGVIGRSKFIYDLWGDTVNTASRMESHALPRTIQVTERAFERLRDRYELRPRGSVQIKGKGAMSTYMLLDRL